MFTHSLLKFVFMLEWNIIKTKITPIMAFFGVCVCVCVCVCACAGGQLLNMLSGGRSTVSDFENHWFKTYFALSYSEGTVWMQQLLVKIMEAVQPDWKEDVTNRVRVPWLEGRTLDNVFCKRKDPRIFRSHFPCDMLPHGVKDKQVKVTICNSEALIWASI